MKLVTYLNNGNEQLACYHEGYLFDLDQLHPDLPTSMGMLLQYWDELFPVLQRYNNALVDGRISRQRGVLLKEASVLAPVPFPTSCRDGYAFRQHVEAARRNRKVDMIPEFDQYPVFYFTNHHSIQGAGDVLLMPDHFEKLDFELECAVLICKPGRNIRAEHADDYIGGLMIMNDLSARTLQMEEMLLNLGPAKGKDFATVIGPWLVTTDELEHLEIPPKEGHIGKCWNMKMTCKVNGVQVSEGNLGDMDWTFAELIERSSYGVNLHAGDIIGSGTVGTGCFLELNGTGKLNNPGYQEQWLKESDTIEMEIEGLGILNNVMVKEDNSFSILGRKRG